MRIWLLPGVALLLSGGLIAQDREARNPDEGKVVVLKLKVGKRSNNVYNMPGFKPKPPLVLKGKAASEGALRDSLEKALEYVLSHQKEEGYWKIERSQLREKGRRNMLAWTARDATGPVVMTALACMALRSHQKLAPRRIEHAVSKGLAYVIEKAPEHTKERYGVWTWSFAIEFLVGEYQRTRDPELRARIKESIQETVRRLLQNQHKGILKARERERPDPHRPVPSEDPNDPRNRTRRVSRGGFLGIVPSLDDEIGKVGALVQQVVPNGPAAKAGMKAGDRILEIDNVKVESVDQLYQIADALEPGKVVTVKVLRSKNSGEQGAARKDQPRRPRARRLPRRGRGPLQEDGGWAYYRIGAMSFPTATAVLALMDAKGIGVEVPQSAIDRGLTLIESLRLTKPGSEDGYAYRTGVLHGPAGDVRASIGRICVCELALYRGHRSTPEYLERAVRVFVKMRGELDRVLGYPGNHFVRSFMNAAYYFLYGHYYCARAISQLKDADKRKEYGAFVQEALLSLQHPEGTWTDHEAWGQLYGTVMALMALGHLKEVTPTAYDRVIESIESKAPREYAPNEY